MFESHDRNALKRPLCTKCRSADVRCYSTIGSGHFARVRYYLCRACGQRFKAVLQQEFFTTSSKRAG